MYKSQWYNKKKFGKKAIFNGHYKFDSDGDRSFVLIQQDPEKGKRAKKDNNESWQEAKSKGWIKK